MLDDGINIILCMLLCGLVYISCHRKLSMSQCIDLPYFKKKKNYLFICLFIYLFIFGCVGSSLLSMGFLQLWQEGATLRRSAWTSHCSGFSCCGAWALGTQPSVVVTCELSSCGARAQLLRGMCLSACQCRNTGSIPGLGRPHMPRSNYAREPQLLSLRSRAYEPQVLKPTCLEPMLHNNRSHNNEKPMHHKEEQPLLSAVRQSPHTATKTQHSQK